MEALTDQKKALLQAMLLAELLHTAGGIDQPLLPGEERVAGGADIDMQFLGGGQGFECVSAGAENLCLMDCRVNVRAHSSSILSGDLSLNLFNGVWPYPPERCWRRIWRKQFRHRVMLLE